MLTDGVDLRGAKLRPWYEREERKKSINFPGKKIAIFAQI